MPTNIPRADTPLRALGPVRVYSEPTESSVFEGQFYEPTNQFVPRAFKSGDPLGRSYGEETTGYLAVYYVVYSTLGPFWSKQYLKLTDLGKTWTESDGGGTPDPEPGVRPYAPEPNGPYSPAPGTAPPDSGVAPPGPNAPGPGALAPASPNDPVLTWLTTNWRVAAAIAFGLVVVTILIARMK